MRRSRDARRGPGPTRLDAAEGRLIHRDGLGLRLEIVELGDHPWFIGCQFHPELQSRPTRPHPLFAGLIAAATSQKRRSETAKADRKLVEAAD